ncbi:BF3164 family lipoprotein [Proteiniphilum acetatigenes]|uniref:BF3164 family lipoprotein n=1 Tax=Proteiniphilum acetatigenes TaxID=294710 RepID=UPI00036FA3A7|nr:BF3164 family lipoprotein [Proteiniphilum acetatigenes]
MKTRILIIFNAILLFSCNKTVNNPIQHFEKSQKQRLTHSRVIDLEEFDILRPGQVIRKDDSYMVWDLKNEKMFHLVNFDSKKVIKGIKIGNGPGEIISPSSLQLKDGRFLICDTDREKISRIDISSDTTLTLKEVEDINFDTRLFVINYQGSHIIATGLFDDAWFASLKGNGEIISKVDFPSFEETSNTTGMELSMLYISTHIVNKPDNKKVVAATQDLGVISFFNYINGSILEEYKQIKYYGPKFILLERGGIAWSKDGPIGFCDLDCDDDYVYALYSGRTFTEHGMESHHCENLLVYDWDGNPVKHYILDTPLFSMKFDNEKNTIYGIGYNPEGVFVEYQLDNLKVKGNTM